MSRPPLPPGRNAHAPKAQYHEDEHSEHPAHEELWLVSYADLMTLLFGFFVILFSMSTLDAKKFGEAVKSAQEKFGGEYQMPTESINREVGKLLKDAGLDKGDVEITQNLEGMELNFKGSSFFASGSADLSPAAQTFIEKTVVVLKKSESPVRVRVEGHTDDVPISSERYPSNWELSSARATSVLRLMESRGIAPKWLEAIGYGSSRPLKNNRDAKGMPLADNMSANRRIVLKIVRIPASELPAAAPAAPNTSSTK